MELHQEEALKKEQEFDAKLADFPHSFQLQRSDTLTTEAIKRIKNHLEAAVASNHRGTTAEEVRTYNLLAYIRARLGQQKEALGELDKALALEGQKDNIVSLANMAVILWRMKRHGEACDLVQRLHDLRRESERDYFRYLVTKAKAELAASYLHFGYRYTEPAIEAFRDVIPESREPETSMWKFGLAVAYRQSLHLQCLPHLSDHGDGNRYEEVLKLLKEVIAGAGADNLNLKANAHAEIGLLIHTTWDENTKQKLCFSANTSPIKSVKTALALDKKDPSILVKSGRLFRYHKDLRSSVQNLKRSIQVQPSSQAYHHLALTFKAMATNFNNGKRAIRRGGKNQQRRKRGKGRGEGGKYVMTQQAEQENGSDEKRDTRQKTDAGGNQATDEKASVEGLGENAKRAGACGTTSKQESFAGMLCEAGPSSMGREAAQKGRSGTFTCETNVPATVAAEVSNDSGVFSLDCEESPETLQERQMPKTGQMLRENQTLPESETLQESVEQMAVSSAEGGVTDEAVAMSDDDDESQRDHDLLIDMDELENAKPAVDDLGMNEDARLFRRLMRAIKSPPNKGVTKFSEHDKYVPEAIENFEKAIDFSERENTRAIYDLALLYKAMGQFDKALNLFEEIYTRPEQMSTGPLDRIGAYEQSGLILIEQLNDTDDNEKQKRTENMLNLALSDSYKFYSRLPVVGVDIYRVWHSVANLLKLADKHDLSDPLQKLKDKLKILRMIKNPEKTLPLVQKLEEMADQKDDVEGLVLCARSYVDMGSYESALLILEALPSGVEHFSQDLIQTVYIHAGKQQLLQNTKTALVVARKRFAAAFTEIFNRSRATLESGETTTCSDSDTMSSDEEESRDPWDVMLLHDDGGKNAGENFAEVLRKGCGLRVTCMAEDVMPGRLEMAGVLRNITRSRVAMVVLATGRSVSRELKTYLDHVATRPYVFAFTLGDDCHIPKALESLKSRKRLFKFPTLLVDATANAFNAEAANAIADIFLSFGTALSSH